MEEQGLRTRSAGFETGRWRSWLDSEAELQVQAGERGVFQGDGV